MAVEVQMRDDAEYGASVAMELTGFISEIQEVTMITKMGN